MCVRVELLLFIHSVVSDSFVTPWTVAHQAPLSMEFSRKKYWSGLPFPPPGEGCHSFSRRRVELLGFMTVLCLTFGEIPKLFSLAAPFCILRAKSLSHFSWAMLLFVTSVEVTSWYSGSKQGGLDIPRWYHHTSAPLMVLWEGWAQLGLWGAVNWSGESGPSNLVATEDKTSYLAYGWEQASQGNEACPFLA